MSTLVYWGYGACSACMQNNDLDPIFLTILVIEVLYKYPITFLLNTLPVGTVCDAFVEGGVGCKDGGPDQGQEVGEATRDVL